MTIIYVPVAGLNRTLKGVVNGVAVLEAITSFIFAAFLELCSLANAIQRSIVVGRQSVRPSVRHTLVLRLNESSYDHAVFTTG